MSQAPDRESSLVNNRTTTKRVSERELVVTRTFDARPPILFAAWTTPDLFRQWWAPKSFGLTLLTCAMDVRVGGTYRLEFGHPESDRPMAFFGHYLEVVPDARLAWTNDEGEQGAVTTVTFEEQDGKTLLAVHDLYPSKQALDDEIASGATSGMQETLGQLEEFLANSAKP